MNDKFKKLMKECYKDALECYGGPSQEIATGLIAVALFNARCTLS